MRRPRIRVAEAEDLAAMAAIEARGMPGGGWTEGELAAQLERFDGRLFVGEEGGLVRGHAVGRALGGEAEILSLVVAPEARRRGLGRALVRVLLEALGTGPIFLEVRAGNVAAQALYAAEGFEPVGKRPGYYPDGEDALLMARP